MLLSEGGLTMAVSGASWQVQGWRGTILEARGFDLVGNLRATGGERRAQWLSCRMGRTGKGCEPSRLGAWAAADHWQGTQKSEPSEGSLYMQLVCLVGGKPRRASRRSVRPWRPLLAGLGSETRLGQCVCRAAGPSWSGLRRAETCRADRRPWKVARRRRT